MSEATIPIKELMEKTEQWLLGQGYKKSTLGFYRATWNRFLSYSASPAYSRETAEQFLLQYFGVDVHAIDQTLDGRMRHARRHMNALDEIFRTGTVCRRKVYGVASIDDDCFDKFFSDYLSYCKMQNFSRSWIDTLMLPPCLVPSYRHRPMMNSHRAFFIYRRILNEQQYRNQHRHLPDCQKADWQDHLYRPCPFQRDRQGDDGGQNQAYAS